MCDGIEGALGFSDLGLGLMWGTVDFGFEVVASLLLYALR